MVFWCFHAFLPSPDTEGYVLGARFMCAFFGILVFLAAVTLRVKAEQLYERGMIMDKTLVTGFRQLMAVCVGLISFIDLSALRALVLDEATQHPFGSWGFFDEMTCIFLAILPVVFGTFVYQLAPWISGAPMSVVMPTTSPVVMPATSPQLEASSTDASSKRAVVNVEQDTEIERRIKQGGQQLQKGACYKCIKYSRLLVFTSTLTIISSFSLIYSANVLNADLKLDLYQRQATLERYDTDGDGVVSWEEFGLGSSRRSLRTNQNDSSIVDTVAAGAIDIDVNHPQRRKLVAPAVPAIIYAIGCIGDFVISLGTAGAVSVGAESAAAYVVGGAVVSGSAKMSYDKFTEVKQCSQSCGKGRCSDADNLGWSCQQIHKAGCSCAGCCHIELKRGGLLGGASFIVADPRFGPSVASTAIIDTLTVLAIMLLLQQFVIRRSLFTRDPVLL